MWLYWKIVISMAAVMTVFTTTLISGTQQQPPIDETIKVMTAVAPVFPPIVVASNTNGEVVIEVKIDSAGNVSATRVLEGHPLLRQIKPIEKTALRWRFNSAAENRCARLLTSFLELCSCSV